MTLGPPHEEEGGAVEDSLLVHGATPEQAVAGQFSFRWRYFTISSQSGLGILGILEVVTVA